MKVIVDSNIIFSALLTPTGKIGDLLFNSSHAFEFYAVNFLRTEIDRHQQKLLEVSKLNENDLNERKAVLYKQIKFIDEFLLPESIILSAENLLLDIDLNDTLHVALAQHIDGHLWTGDKILIHGLHEKQFKNVITTLELWELRSKILGGQ